MVEAQAGDTVLIHYHGTFDDGTVFDSTREKDPFEMVIGKEIGIPGFEKAVLGMSEGEVKSVKVLPEDGFGVRNEELVVEMDKENITQHVKEPEVGMMLRVRDKGGEGANNVVIVDISDDKITLDGNHPLAGKILNFEIQLVKVAPAE